MTPGLPLTPGDLYTQPMFKPPVEENYRAVDYFPAPLPPCRNLVDNVM